jgi:hypothetical protein
VAPAFARQRRAGWAGAEANLLIAVGTDDGAVGVDDGFASFENTLLTLGSAEHEYQCVWNAAGISDNRAFAGGVSEYLFAPAMAYAGGAAGSRCSKACSLWPLESRHNDVRLPVLPLQNTVSVATTQHVMTDSQAYVLSHWFDGVFAGVDDVVRDSLLRIWPVRAGAGVGQLAGAHVGGRGQLFLMLTLR